MAFARKTPLPRLPRPTTKYLPFTGGMDLETSSLQIKGGVIRDSLNYEHGVEGGYVDVMGYERVDGQAAPSEATYAVYAVTISGSITVGDTITGATSGATAEVIGIDDDDLYLVITKIVGTFTDSEDLEVSAVVEATATASPVTGGASTLKLNGQYLALAADEYRTDIAAIPGEGSVLGVARLNDVLYGFRNAVGAATAELYKSTAAGWVQVALGRELSFTSGGTTEIAEGDTITGATSAATAVITRVCLESGSWAGGDAAGRLIFASQTGTFQSENLDVGVALNLATIAGDSSAITLLPSGRYEMFIDNFANPALPSRLYGCDGVNRGFQFDGTVFAPIDTGMATDTPEHLIVHKRHLFFSFKGSSQHSGLGLPFSWSPVLGASEIATGGDITGYNVEPGEEGNATLLIANTNKLYVLYGNSSADWNLVAYRDEVGARPYTIQQVGITLFLDDIGITNFRTTQAYGNFVHSSLTSHIRRWIKARLTRAVASTKIRQKDQYRLFFSDNYVLYLTMAGKKIMGAMPVYLPDAVKCTWNSEGSDGTEHTYFGSDDGFVYEMERGTSFDGASIDAFLTLHPWHAKALEWIKSFHNFIIESSAEGYAEWDIGYTLDYSSALKGQPDTLITEEGEFTSVIRWDTPGITWDTPGLFWDGSDVRPSNSVKIRGAGENISFSIYKSSNYFAPVRHSGGSVRHAYRRLKR